MRKHVRPGYVLAIAAIALGMTGSAVAASKITGAQIKDGTITSKDIKNSSISASDLSDATLDTLSGTPGPAGPAGPMGPAGPTDVARITPVEAKVLVSPGTTQFAIAFCPSGMSAVGGGYTALMGYGSEVWSNERTDSGLGWVAHAWNLNDYVSGDLTVTAYCAPTGKAVAASRSSTEQGDRRAEARKVQAKMQLAHR